MAGENCQSGARAVFLGGRAIATTLACFPSDGTGQGVHPCRPTAITLPEGAAAKWQLGSHSDHRVNRFGPGSRGLRCRVRVKHENDNSRRIEQRLGISETSPLALVASDGAIASAPVPARGNPATAEVKFTKLDVLDSRRNDKEWDPVFQTVRVPLMAFHSSAGSSRRFDLSKLSMVRLKFDPYSYGRDVRQRDRFESSDRWRLGPRMRP